MDGKRVRRSRAGSHSSSVSVTGFVLALALSCGAAPTVVGETGIRGQVLMGPVTPGPQREGEPDEAPFSALFHVLDDEEIEAARFESDDDGYFEVVLAPGDYTIVPDASAPLMNPTRQRHEVTVPQEDYAEVTLRFDTGLR